MSSIHLADLMQQVAEDERRDLDAFVKGHADAPVLFRQVSGAVLKQEGEGAIDFTLSHESEDRMGDVIRQDGWDLESFKRNPVMLWAHNSTMPPIGKWSNLRVENKALLGAGVFDNDKFSNQIEQKVRRGFINAVSVGFRPLEFKPLGSEFNDGLDFTKSELLEVSVVPVPAHPRAVRRALAELDEKRRWIFMPQEKGYLLIPEEDGMSVTKAIDEPEPVAEVEPDAQEQVEPETVERADVSATDQLEAALQRAADALDKFAEMVARFSGDTAEEKSPPVPTPAAEPTAEEKSADADTEIKSETHAYREELQRLLKSLTED